jgi:hypothetical protein
MIGSDLERQKAAKKKLISRVFMLAPALVAIYP